MSVEENKALVRREQAELWNHTGNLDAAAELFAPDRVEDAKQEAASVRRGFPDLESTIEDLIAERDKVVAHWRAQATHQGEYMGIPPASCPGSGMAPICRIKPKSSETLHDSAI